MRGIPHASSSFCVDGSSAMALCTTTLPSSSLTAVMVRLSGMPGSAPSTTQTRSLSVSMGPCGSTFHCASMAGKHIGRSMDPLLLIHGTGCDAAAFDSLVPLLSPRYRVIAYDRRGYGRPHSAHAADALAILDERAPGEAAFVVGWSAGAIVALELASLHPSRVRGLVLLEPPLWAKKAFAPALMLAMVRVAWNTLRKRPRAGAAA